MASPSQRLNEAFTETVDKISKDLDSFFDRAAEIGKDSNEDDDTQNAIDKLSQIRKDLQKGGSDAIKNASQTLSDISDSLKDLFRDEQGDESS